MQLLLANIHSSDEKPVVVHTDLRDEWHIYWLDGSTVWVHTPKSRFVAVALIEDLLSKRTATQTHGLASSSEGAEVERDEPVFLKRRKFTVPDVVPDEAVAQIVGLQGFLPQDEIQAALAECILQQFNKLPCVMALRDSSPPPPDRIPCGMYI